MPYDFTAVCPECGNTAFPSSGQIGAWKAVHKHGRTGPITTEGRTRVSDANKNRDTATYKVSRFNAITHGATTEVAKYFPARPSKYDQCEGCEYLGNGCGDEMQHCAKRTEIFMQFSMAQEQGDGRLLGPLMASTQAGLMSIVSDMIRSIALRGVEIETPMYVKSEAGGIELARYIDANGRERLISEIKANPLLKPLIDFISKNGMTLSDLSLTPAATEESKRFAGHLANDQANRETMQEALTKQSQQHEALMKIVNRGSQVLEGTVIDAE